MKWCAGSKKQASSSKHIWLLTAGLLMVIVAWLPFGSGDGDAPGQAIPRIAIGVAVGCFAGVGAAIISLWGVRLLRGSGAKMSAQLVGFAVAVAGALLFLYMLAAVYGLVVVNAHGGRYLWTYQLTGNQIRALRPGLSKSEVADIVGKDREIAQEDPHVAGYLIYRGYLLLLVYADDRVVEMRMGRTFETSIPHDSVD